MSAFDVISVYRRGALSGSHWGRHLETSRRVDDRGDYTDLERLISIRNGL